MHTRHPLWLCFCLILESLLQTTPQHHHEQLFFFFKLIYLFDFWLCWVFVAALRLSPVAASEGYSLAAAHRLLTAAASLAAEHTLQAHGRQQLWGTGFVVSPRVESFRTRDRTYIRWIGRQILTHCTTREVCHQHLEGTTTR